MLLDVSLLTLWPWQVKVYFCFHTWRRLWLSSSLGMQACVQGMFQLKDDSAFKQHLRDFLVQTKSFADKNNADLYAEEAAQQREV